MYAGPWSVCRVPSCGQNLALFAEHLYIKSSSPDCTAQWVERRPTEQKATGLIPSRGTCLGCGPGPWLGHMQEETN